MKFTRRKLIEIHNGLKGISAVKLTEGAWNVVRNLKTVGDIITEQDEAYKVFYEQCIDKDEKGVPVSYKEKAIAGNGEVIERDVSRISYPDKKLVHLNFVKDMESQEYELDLIHVSKNAFNKAIEKGDIDLIHLAPLMDVMIPDPDKKVEKKEE